VVVLLDLPWLLGSRNGQISLWPSLKQEPTAPNIKTKLPYLVLIFGGEHGHGLIYSVGMSYINGLTGTSYDWQYKTAPQPNAGGNSLSWPRGKGLGGSSAMNGGFWCRGSSVEYDAWNTLQNGTSGAQDWGWGTMQAAIKKVCMSSEI
jgi:choline dehydrogenase-like flavoprotein